MYVYMYVCMWVCMCVCMYICKYVCMYVCVCMCICMYVCTYVNMYVHMYVCMCVCVCTCMHLLVQFIPSSVNFIFQMHQVSRRMRWAGHVARMGRGEAYTGFWWRNLRVRDRLGDLGVDGKITLR